MRKGILLIGLALLLVASLVVVGCAAPAPAPKPTPAPTPAPAPKPEPKDFPIGFLCPLSGPLTFAGETMLNASNLAAEEVNNAGGVTVAGQPYKIKIISYDTKYATEDARAGAERLMFQDKVKFIIGALSLDTQGFQGITEQNQVIILPAGGSILPSPKTPYTFRITALVDAKYIGLYKYIKGKMPELKSIAFINPDTPVGEQYEKMSRSAAEPLGFTVAASERIAVGSSDVSPQISRVLAKKPDIIDLGATGGGSDSALVIKQARSLGFTGQMVAAVGLTSKTVLEVVGPQGMEGVMETGYSIDDPTLGPEFKALVKKYTERFPKLPFIDLTSETYDAVLAFFKFFNGQTTLDPVVLKDKLAEYSWTGIYGKCYFGGEKTFGIKRAKVQPIYLSRWQGGKPFVVTIVDAPVP